MQRLQILAAALAAIVLAVPAAAQSARAMGTVRDLEGNPVRGATIRALNPDAYPAEITSTSDNKGRWAMVGLRTGSWRFVVDAPGYFRTEGTAPVRVAASAPLQFTLAKDPGPIAGALTQNIMQQINQATALRDKGYHDMALAAFEEIRVRNPKLTAVSMVIGDIYRQKATTETAAATRKVHLQRAADAFADALKGDDTNDRARAALESTRAETAKIP
jgi:hypothetical protein